MIERRKLVLYLAIVLINLSFLLVLLVGAEAAYRWRLYQISPSSFIESTEPDRVFAIYNDSPWRFHERYGYEYVPGTITGWAIVDGKIMRCGVAGKYDRLGNPGDSRGSYADAELKILVFGDSWMGVMRPRDGFLYTVPSMLQQRLEEQIGKKVHVMNFGRDGYGILQMFDLAVDKIDEYKPDVAIFAFITDDLSRDRFWRTVVDFDGERRVLTTLDPLPNPDASRAADTQLNNAKGSAEACDKLPNNPILNAELSKEFTDQHIRAKQRIGGRRPSLLSLSSYLYSRLRYGNPFFRYNQEKRPSVNPRHQLHDFMDDPRFAENIAKINAMGVPCLFIHLAIYNEIRDNQEYVFGQPAQETGLLASLAKATRRTIHPTLGNVPLPTGDLSAINSSPDDYHPSLTGMEFYADLMIRVLEKEVHIHGAKRRAPPFVRDNRLSESASN